MARYHINEQGNPGPCRATRDCPFGALDEHWPTKEAAREAYEQEAQREVWFQQGRKELQMDRRLSPPLKRELRRQIAAVEENPNPTKSEASYRVLFQDLIRQHEEEFQLRQAQEAWHPDPGPKRVGELLVEEKRDRAEPYTQVMDLSGQPVATLTEGDAGWAAMGRGQQDLGTFGSKSEALAAAEAYQATLYRMRHQPDPEGPQAHEADAAFPDFYAHPEYYRSGNAAWDRESIQALQAMRGNPEAEVTIYRALPDATYGFEVGNWVTLSKTYAQDHAEQATSEAEPWPVIEMRVKAKDIRTPADSINEWGYYPESS